MSKNHKATKLERLRNKARIAMRKLHTRKDATSQQRYNWQGIVTRYFEARLLK